MNLSGESDAGAAWAAAAAVPDPEVPCVSVAELGILRWVRLEDGVAVAGVTPTYSGCPATLAIEFAVEAALREVLIAVAFAFVSVLLVIYGFLGTFRVTLIPALTIPVSVIAAFMALYGLGYSINVLTLLGVVLAIGLVVDDSIVVLENIHRRAEMHEPPMVAAIRGSREIGFAVVATTLTLVARFLHVREALPVSAASAGAAKLSSSTSTIHRGLEPISIL